MLIIRIHYRPFGVIQKRHSGVNSGVKWRRNSGSTRESLLGGRRACRSLECRGSNSCTAADLLHCVSQGDRLAAWACVGQCDNITGVSTSSDSPAPSYKPPTVMPTRVHWPHLAHRSVPTPTTKRLKPVETNSGVTQKTLGGQRGSNWSHCEVARQITRCRTAVNKVGHTTGRKGRSQRLIRTSQLVISLHYSDCLVHVDAAEKAGPRGGQSGFTSLEICHSGGHSEDTQESTRGR